MNYNEIASKLGYLPKQIDITHQLLEDGKTIPFITRYRKEMTMGLSELDLRKIKEELELQAKLEERKKDLLSALTEMNKLSPQLEADIQKASTMRTLDDLWLPFKKKKKTLADIAKEKGLEPLVHFLWTCKRKDDSYLRKFINPEKELSSVQDVLQYTLYIIAEDIALTPRIREYVRKQLIGYGSIYAEKIASADDPKELYKDYYEFEQRISKIPSYRILAINRGENEKVLRIKLHIDPPIERIAGILSLKNDLAYYQDLLDCILDSYKRLLFPSIEREIRNEITNIAENRAIEVFSLNLKSLLYTPPFVKKRILGLDPGYRTGCKCAIIDDNMNFLHSDILFVTHSDHLRKQAEDRLNDMLAKYHFEIIAIGNGTASRETEQFIADWIQNYHHQQLHYLIVSEAGASVYSVSDNAIQEFPDLDPTIRSAISIGRRAGDLLNELVKIPPQSIGVGMYQHDVNQNLLSQKLSMEIESVVNNVGVDINSASVFLLQYVSGLNKTTAKAIVDFRNQNPIRSRKDLLKVKGIGVRAYELCAGFCRVTESKNYLDQTIIHPESYDKTLQFLKYIHLSLDELRMNKNLLLDTLEKYDCVQVSTDLQISLSSLQEIIYALTSRKQDPREEFHSPLLRQDILNINDLSEGMLLQGTVRNIVDFGAFVDIGLKSEALLHRSYMKDSNKSPYETLYTGEIIDVEILSIDKERNRISLRML